MWENIKKIFALKNRRAPSAWLNDYVSYFPCASYFSDLYIAYYQSHYNTWENLISRFGLDALDKGEARKCLIEKFKKYLPNGAWTIDEQDEDFIKVKVGVSEPILQPAHNPFSRECLSSEEIAISATYWKKIKRFLKKNIFNTVNFCWNFISGIASLFMWITFLIPLIPILATVLLFLIPISIYLIFSYIFLKETKQKFISPEYLEDTEANKMLEYVIRTTLNEDKYQKQFNEIANILADLNIKQENLYQNLFFEYSESTHLPKQIEHTSLYKRLNRGHFIIQFIASCVSKIINFMFYASIIAWTASIFLKAVGALMVAGIIISPVVLGLFFLGVACIVITSHFYQHRTIIKNYQTKIKNFLEEPLKEPYEFKDEKGNISKKKLSKWEQFALLHNKIIFLEAEIKTFKEQNEPSEKSAKIFQFFDKYINNADIYKSKHPDETQQQNIFSGLKSKIFKSIFFFTSGAFNGFFLATQIIFKNNLSLNLFFKTLLLPVNLLIFLPIVIIAGVANIFSYCCDTRQRNSLLFAENIDSHIQRLEHRIKMLSNILIILKALENENVEESVSKTLSENTSNNTLGVEKYSGVYPSDKTLAYLDLALPVRNNRRRCPPPCNFFTSPIHSLSSVLDLATIETNRRPNLTP